MVKKLLLGMTIVCVFLLASCRSTDRQTETDVQTVHQNNLGRVLILYYTWSEHANTENAAKIIQGLTNADMIKV